MAARYFLTLVKMGSSSVGRWIATDQMADWLISEAYPIDDPPDAG